MKTAFLFFLISIASAYADLFQEGIDAYHESEYAMATKSFENASAEEETGAARHNLALSLYQEGKPSKAVWQLERALLLEPHNEQFHFKLGALRQQLGLYATRPGWHELASQAISSQSWIIILTVSFWLLIAVWLLPRIGGFQTSLPLKAIRYLSLISLLVPASALFLNRHQSSLGIMISETPTELRAAPASAAPQSGLARPGERGQIVDRHNGFVEVETEGGARGWLNEESFRLVQP